LFDSTKVLALGCAISAQRLMTSGASNLAAVLASAGFHTHAQTTIKATEHLFQKALALLSQPRYRNRKHLVMGALLSLPLLAVPSMGTVRILPGASVCTPLMRHLSYSVSAPHAAEQLLAQQYAAYVESFRAGSLSLTTDT
jgi:hypothetical protein